MTWIREMGGLLRDYWRADREYRAAMKTLKQWMRDNR